MGLTEKRIRDAKPETKSRIIWDGQVKGLGVRVTPAGAKAFVLSYRIAGRKRLATLARCSELSLRDARERAGGELTAIRAGETDPLQRRQDAIRAPTVADGLDRFFDQYAPRRIADGLLTERTVKDYRFQAKRTVRPKLGKLKIADVTRHDVERAVADRAPVQRNRTVAFISRLFSAFEEWEWRAPNSNPSRRIERTREQPRERVLAPSELRALGRALDTLDNPFVVGAIRFLLMTGWRTGEALALEWDRVNFETSEILLPETKAGRETRLVGAVALETLADLPRMARDNRVFAGLTYATLRRHFGVACQRAGIPDARLHDIRRTVATAAAAHGVSVFLLRDLLNHKTVEMANRYARRAGTAVQQAQDAVASHTAALLAGRDGEVVELRGRHA